MNPAERKLLLTVLLLLLFGGVSRAVLSATERPVSWQELPSDADPASASAPEPALAAADSDAAAAGKAAENGGKSDKKGKKGKSSKRAKGEKLPPLAPGERIDVNSASAAQLRRLPGVGPALAEAIVAHRDSCGPFEGPENLLKVKGIGKGKLETLIPKIRFRK